jgi:hypothetical protein
VGLSFLSPARLEVSGGGGRGRNEGFSFTVVLLPPGWLVSILSPGASLVIQAGRLVFLPRPSPEVDCVRIPAPMFDDREDCEEPIDLAPGGGG